MHIWTVHVDAVVRVVPVLGVNGGDPSDGVEKLSWLEAAYGPPTSFGLATVGAGLYVGPGDIKSPVGLTTDKILDGMISNIAKLATSAHGAYSDGNPVATYTTLASYYGMILHAYEGGPDTSTANEHMTNVTDAVLLIQAQASQDPRMAKVVEGIINTWYSWGAGLFNFFELSAGTLLAPWGSYSLLWDMRVTDTPKARGLDSVVEAAAVPVTAGLALPVHGHPANQFVGCRGWHSIANCVGSFREKDGSLSPAGPLEWLPLNGTFNYLLRAPSASRDCALRVTVCSGASGTGSGNLEVSVGAFLPAQTVRVSATKGCVATTFQPFSAARNGLVTLRLRVPTEQPGYVIDTIGAECS